MEFNANKINDALKQKHEYEIRFGSCKESVYINGISKNDYYNVMQILDNRYKKYSKRQTINSYIYNNNIRKQDIIENEKIVKSNIIEKNRLDIKDNFDYSFREAISEEKKVYELPKNNKYTERIKERIIYSVQYNIEIHLTRVNKNSYELELEVIKEHEKINVIVKDFVVYLLKILQRNDIIIKNNDVYRIKELYLKHFKKPFCFLAQPETMIKKNLEKYEFCLNNYSLTYKIDGIRNILVVDRNGYIYTIYFCKSNGMIINGTSFYTKEFKECIMDAEVFGNSIFCIDILIFNGEDLRKNKTNLKERLSMLNNIVDSVLNCDENQKRIFMKQYYFNNDMINMINQWDNMIKGPVKFDGLIFTPINDPYPMKKKSNILKWKPDNLNTIDFLYRNKGMYYKTSHIDSELTQFEPSFKINHDNIKFKLYDNMIVECLIIGDVIYIIRNRHDKRYPNFKHVVDSNYESIKNPLKLNQINVALQNQTKPLNEVNEKSNFYLMRKLHNHIKRKIIVNNINDGDIIIDIGIGKGGDIPKYIEKKNIQIKGYDINDEYISEAKSRIRLNKWDKDAKIEINKLDIGKEIVECTENSVDVVNMQFSLQFFFESDKTLENLMNFISKSLKVGGKFIISILDGYRIYNLLKEHNGKFDNDGVCIDKMYDDKKDLLDLPLCGNKIKTYINCETITDEGVIEYLVNYSEFINYTKMFNLELIHSQNYNNYYKEWILSGNKELNDIEIKYSDLHRVMILRKKGDTDDIMNIEQFKRCFKGLLIPITQKNPDNYTKLQLEKMKLNELKIIAGNMGKKISGKKIELVQRILID